MKLKKIEYFWYRIFYFALKKHEFFNSLTARCKKKSENVSLFAFISFFHCFGVFIYIQCYFDIVKNLQTEISPRVNQTKIKSSSECGLNLDLWKTFFGRLWADKNLVMACLQNYIE